MNTILFTVIATIILGLADTFYSLTKQMKKSNDIGNDKGEYSDYTSSFYLLNIMDDVPESLDIDTICEAADCPVDIHSYNKKRRMD